MMSRKNMIRWALIMLVVFGLITVVYPLIFKPGDALPQSTSPVPTENGPVQLPAGEPKLPAPADSTPTHQ